MPGVGASVAARLAMKSAGVNPDDPYGIENSVSEVMKSLESQGIKTDRDYVRGLVREAVGKSGSGLVQKATDPVILPQPYVTPTDFSGQYPQPLDPTEILTLCEEINVWKTLPGNSGPCSVMNIANYPNSVNSAMRIPS